MAIAVLPCWVHEGALMCIAVMRVYKGRRVVLSYTVGVHGSCAVRS